MLFCRKGVFYGYSTIKEELHQYIDKADDRILRLVKGMFQADIEDYTLSGEPMNEETLKQRVRDAKSRIGSGQFTTQEDLEKEMEEW
ncbi:hypothetical protein [Marinoscillum furvescens]|uniref:Addiction module component n=1 Tax=Marinoscillum furvescens DSM 4134 TaxID=1122208 RepID=A0A3D9LGA7_MARFU|nr:hypothetical protein [Marinoscillum furvescens]REE05637.1 hypothetical protein C7460_101154 [Marinoscillum furvescens DSM 4134]